MLDRTASRNIDRTFVTWPAGRLPRAARQIGVYGGLFPVLSFLHGVHIVAKDGLSCEDGIIVCMSFWLGIGFQNQQILADHLPHWSCGLLDNGKTAGGIGKPSDCSLASNVQSGLGDDLLHREQGRDVEDAHIRHE
jgi:hypothetical protein